MVQSSSSRFPYRTATGPSGISSGTGSEQLGGGGSLALHNSPESAYRSSSRHLRSGVDSSNPIGSSSIVGSSRMDLPRGGSSSFMAAGVGSSEIIESPPKPFATSEDFENMVGDLRRTFIGWLKKTEVELGRERESLRADRKTFEEEKKKLWKALLTEKQIQHEKMDEERRRAQSEASSAMQQISIEREDARQRISDERDKLERERELWRRQAVLEREKFLEECESFEEERRKIVDSKIAAQTMVDLNVGGVVFETSRHTLIQQPGSFLEGLFSGRHQLPRDRVGRTFVDRDSELFRILLQFLRNPSAPPCPRDSAESSAICTEAEYYGLKFFAYPLVFAIGGHNGVDHVPAVEVLDVKQECWRPCQSLNTARTYFGCTVKQGRLFAFGGQNYEYKALCDVEVYDVLRDVWMPAPSLSIPRRNTCGASLGDRIFAIGGFDGASILSSVEAYDPRMKNWMEVCPMVTPRSSACCSVVGDYIYALGGTSGDRVRTVERFDSRANKWEELDCEMIEARSAACAAAMFSSVFVMGGTDNTHKVHSSVESLDQHPHVSGGQDEEVFNSSLFYRPELDEWRNATSAPLLQHFGGVVVYLRKQKMTTDDDNRYFLLDTTTSQYMKTHNVIEGCHIVDAIKNPLVIKLDMLPPTSSLW